MWTKCVLVLQLTSEIDIQISFFQRKIFTFAELYLPRLGYAKRAHLMNAMVPGLAGGKMSSSDPNSKIDFLDSPELVKKKIKLAFCEPGNITENGLLSFVKAVLIPISQLRIERLKGQTVLEEGLGDQRPFIADDAPEGTVFTIGRPEKHGGPSHYKTYEEMEQDFADQKLHPGDLKSSVTEAIVRLLTPIRQVFEQSKEWQEITSLAYPDPNAKKEVKKKKVSCRVFYNNLRQKFDYSTTGEKVRASSPWKGQ